MEIHELLTPFNYKTGTIDRIEYIVIHYVGATGGAEANCKYYAACNRGASAHYFVGHDGEIWRCVEDKNIAWHCGGKKYTNTKGATFHGICTNANSIGIEMCVRKSGTSWYFEDATVNATIELTKRLMELYGVPADRVIRHYDVTGKNCPEPFVRDENAWKSFKNSITKQGHWVFSGKDWYYMDSTGPMVRDCWKLINHHWYLFAEDGKMLTGWQSKNGQLFYLEESGDYQGACWHEADGHNGSLERWYVE